MTERYIQIQTGQNVKGDNREVFYMMGSAWDVTKAKEIADSKKLTSLRAANVDKELSGWLNMGVMVDHDHAMTVDLSNPIIFAQYVDPTDKTWHGVLIDGYHRVHRAVIDGVLTLPVIILTRKESKQVRLR